MYGKLGIYFDEFHGESFYKSEKCLEILEAMESKDLVHSSADGRKLYRYGDGREVTLLKSDGSSIYLTRDIAAAVDRFQRWGQLRANSSLTRSRLNRKIFYSIKIILKVSQLTVHA